MLAPTAAANDPETEYSELDYQPSALCGPAKLCSYPRGRTLHLVDFNNLLGCAAHHPALTDAAHAVSLVLGAYRTVARARVGDHELLLKTLRLVLEAKVAFPACRIALRRGSAFESIPLDIAAPACSSRYDRVVVGSGDGSFAPLTTALIKTGIVVHVVSRRRALSRALASVPGLSVGLLNEGNMEEHHDL